MNDYFSFFFDNKSGWKTNEKILSKKNPKLFEEIKTFSEKNSLNDLKFQQQIWHFINKYTTIPKCNECGKNLEFGRSLKEGYGKYCSLLCTNKNKDHINKSRDKWLSKKKETQEKIKETNLKKYGVENTFQNIELVKNGFLKKHGVTHVSKIDGVAQKIKNTFLEKYGCTSNFTRDDVRQKLSQNKQFNFILKYPNVNFINHTGNTLSIKCDKCESVYTITRTLFRHRTIFNKIPCTICVPLNSSDSFFEKEILEFIKTIYNGEIIENDRTIISPKELDIFIPDLGIAIEFNGLYWHSSEFVNKNYHLNKTKQCNNKNIDLIHIFEDEWFYKKEIVKSIIKTKIKNNINYIYGRKCVINEIDSKTYKNFCQLNHIQGSVNASFKLGLFFNEELVSVMSFGQLRKSLGSKKEDKVYEMLRFCTKLNTSVIGGASKLFNFFIKKYNPKKIISFSDMRYFKGDIYEKLNFKFEKQTTPNYYYITDYLKRENRFKYRKDVLVSNGYDKNKTELEIMSELGVYRIWDCGNRKWIWEK